MDMKRESRLISALKLPLEHLEEAASVLRKSLESLGTLARFLGTRGWFKNVTFGTKRPYFPAVSQCTPGVGMLALRQCLERDAWSAIK